MLRIKTDPVLLRLPSASLTRETPHLHIEFRPATPRRLTVEMNKGSMKEKMAGPAVSDEAS